MQIESDDGPVTINTENFDAETMKAYVPSKEKPAKKLTKKQQEAFDKKTAERAVAEREGVFYVVDGHGKDVVDPAVSAEGYENEDAAKAIITAMGS